MSAKGTSSRRGNARSWRLSHGGYKNKELADKIYISEQTVRNHMRNIFDKLGVSDRLELGLFAIQNHLHEMPGVSIPTGIPAACVSR